jgi:hypothetical protein
MRSDSRDGHAPPASIVGDSCLEHPSAVLARPRFTKGQGLGNRLFPWARARVFAREHGARFVTPRWTRLGLGSWLRGGLARRHHGTQVRLAGLFRPRPGDVDPWLARWSTIGALHVEEPDDPRAPWIRPDPGRSVVVEFRGLGLYFFPLLGSEAFLRDELRAITRPEWLALADGAGEAPIVLNVRRGPDVQKPRSGERRLRSDEATPLDWFVRTLGEVRAAAGGTPDAVVVSDGSEAELAPLLRLPSVRLLQPSSAISDLLVASRARVLLASGASTFSAWAAFLGGMPAATHPGQPLVEFALPPSAGAASRVEFDPDAPDATFLSTAAAAIAR